MDEINNGGLTLPLLGAAIGDCSAVGGNRDDGARIMVGAEVATVGN